ncbi:MAG TPA: zinc-dependent metalloprotease [Actinomycetota bacterium]|nr:zinc-dependent metalloprotease [Actinomycetota bacterium]
MPVLFDPWLARSIARRVAGRDAVSGTYLHTRLARDLDSAIPRAEALVADATGIAPPSPANWKVIDRARWADANIAGMSELLKPLAEKLDARARNLPLPVRMGQRAIISVEIGLLLGYVARRVLGQYDLVFAAGGRRKDRGNDGVLYFVATNLVETERRFGFVPEEFALWVALHEVTHRFQFAGVPWLREHFLALVHSYLASLDLDARSLAARFGTAVSRLASKGTPPEERSPVYLFATDEQRERVDRLQALMAVIEGHGNYVMDTVGAREIPSFGRMRAVFEGRRAQQNALQRAISHAIGLEMKLRQYELGQKFCNEVAAQGGPDSLALIWSSPDALPTLAELRSPASWMARMSGAASERAPA